MSQLWCTRVYLDALRWPYEQNTSTWMQWNYHKVLATASVVKRFRELGYSRDRRLHPQSGGDLPTLTRPP
ncbi:beta-glucosidase [Klebsiella pneumoniae]|uniref:Beta-glucosidase n=1 Tax=Klebsiella pneumoniae TaxID=573 RepID=A0A378FQP1_KLEPN|nr:beta-glucosidase [Klebsiella pneumoniae]